MGRDALALMVVITIVALVGAATSQAFEASPLRTNVPHLSSIDGVKTPTDITYVSLDDLGLGMTLDEINRGRASRGQTELRLRPRYYESRLIGYTLSPQHGLSFAKFNTHKRLSSYYGIQLIPMRGNRCIMVANTLRCVESALGKGTWVPSMCGNGPDVIQWCIQDRVLVRAFIDHELVYKFLIIDACSDGSKPFRSPRGTSRCPAE